MSQRDLRAQVLHLQRPGLVFVCVVDEPITTSGAAEPTEVFPGNEI